MCQMQRHDIARSRASADEPLAGTLSDLCSACLIVMQHGAFQVSPVRQVYTPGSVSWRSRRPAWMAKARVWALRRAALSGDSDAGRRIAAP